MKRLALLMIVATLATGCATESFLNDDGTRNWRGRLLWSARDAVGWEASEPVETAWPYEGVQFAKPDHPPATDQRIEYKDWIPQTWVPIIDAWCSEWNVTRIDYPEFPNYREFDITDTSWGSSQEHMIRTMREFEENRRNYKLVIRERDGRTIVGKFKSYGGRIE